MQYCAYGTKSFSSNQQPCCDMIRSQAFYDAVLQAPDNPQVRAALQAGLQNCRILSSQTPPDVIRLLDSLKLGLTLLP